MNILLEKLAYTFQDKPLPIGGMVMEYYGLRKIVKSPIITFR